MHGGHLHDHIIVQQLEELAERVGATMIPDSASERPQQAEVVAAGLSQSSDAGERVRPDVTAGDTLQFGEDARQEITSPSVESLLMKVNDVLAIHDAGRAPNRRAARNARMASRSGSQSA